VHIASSFVCHVYPCLIGYGCKLRMLIVYRSMYVQQNILLTGEKEKICMVHANNAKNSMCSCMPFKLKELSIYVHPRMHGLYTGRYHPFLLIWWSCMGVSVG
jgi:hypothetical protein